jgi:hypothetical protein
VSALALVALLLGADASPWADLENLTAKAARGIDELDPMLPWVDRMLAAAPPVELTVRP